MLDVSAVGCLSSRVALLVGVLVGFLAGSACTPTDGTDEACAVGVERACERNDGDEGRERCEEGDAWSGVCESALTECSNEQCESSGLCTTTTVLTPATSESTWLLDIGPGGIGLVTERMDDRSILEFQALSDSGLRQKDAVPLVSTNLSVARASLLALQDRFVVSWETWLGGTRQDVGIDVLGTNGESLGSVRYLMERRAGWLYPAEEGFIHVFYDDGVLQRQSLSLSGEELGKAHALDSTNGAGGTMTHAWSGETHMLVASTQTATPTGRVIFWLGDDADSSEPVAFADGFFDELVAGWNGENFAVAWLADDGAWLAEYDESGAELSSRNVLEGDLRGVALAAIPGGWLVIATRDGVDGRDVVVRRIDGSGRWQPVVVAEATGDARNLQLTVDGTRVQSGWRLRDPESSSRVQHRALSLCE